MPPRLVILDRDGVINEDSDDYIKTLDEWKPIPGSIDAIVRLSLAGYLIAVATNQSGIARGIIDESDLAAMHGLLRELVEPRGGKIDGVFFCPHHVNEGCDCRKPRTGLLKEMEREFNMSVKGAWFVGDTEKDIGAALSMGCLPILVRTGKGKATEDGLSDEQRRVVTVVDSLADAADLILSLDARPAVE